MTKFAFSTALASVALLLGAQGAASHSGHNSPALEDKKKSSRAAGEWVMFGRDLAGSHFNPDESQVTPATVGRLKPKWIFEARGDVSSQPVAAAGMIYFGSWGGREYAVDAATGVKVWEFTTGAPQRSSAVFAQGTLFFGDLAGILYAIDGKSGALKWKTKLDPHPAAIASSSPIYFNGTIYIGISSKEEVTSTGKDYECCTFRGGVLAIDASTGKQIWRFHTIPQAATPQKKDANGRQLWGPSGASVWSTVSIDPGANRLYLTTGNQYSGPETKYSDAIVALDLKDGTPVWSLQIEPGDNWTNNCDQDPTDCGKDGDFGTVPLSFKGARGMLLGAGRKDGWFYAVDPRNGKLEWKTEVANETNPGKIYYGNSTDGPRIYLAVSNAFKEKRQGFICCLDGATGKLLWRTLAPDQGSNHGPITVTGTGKNELVFAGSTGGHICAYGALDGKIIWDFDTQGGISGGPIVVDGIVYVGSGNGLFGTGRKNNALYAFSIDGK